VIAILGVIKSCTCS